MTDSTAELDPEKQQLAAQVLDLARHGDSDTIAGHVDGGVSANLANDSGDALVMLAASHGHLATVQALLERGANPDQANNRGQTPLSGALFKRHDDIVRTLPAHGADPDAGSPSAVETARTLGRADLLEIFQGK